MNILLKYTLLCKLSLALLKENVLKLILECQVRFLTYNIYMHVKHIKMPFKNTNY